MAALEMICAVGPDVIVTDLDGRDLDGFVLCRVLRGLAAHFMLPVLVLTNKAAGDAGALAMAALGNVRVMRKPAMPVLVVAAVAEMLNIVPVGSRGVALPGSKGVADRDRAASRVHGRLRGCSTTRRCVSLRGVEGRRARLPGCSAPCRGCGGGNDRAQPGS